ncbi:MAG: hypothetical protein N3E37_04425 [Candidatus Micrarchaeota archaeon]|nr:hypothetical protein [Candidatus Micrarchaeota archaeon]
MKSTAVEELLYKDKKDVSFSDVTFKLKIIGLGGCGTNIVNRLSSLGISNNVIAINTDALQLNSVSSGVRKFLIGKNITRGFGCGGNPELGKRVMEESLESLIKLLPDTDLSIIVLGLSGGTGHGGIIPLVEKLKEIGNDVIVIATIPFKIEKSKREVAKKKAQEIADKADSLILFDNQVLVETSASLPISNSFYVIDEKIAELLNAFDSIFNKPSLINLDYADMKALLTKGRGFGSYASASIPKHEEMYRLEEKLSEFPLLLGNRQTAKAALLYLTSNNSIPIADAIKALEISARGIPESAEVAFGVDLVGSPINYYAKVFAVYFGTELDISKL